MKCASQGLPTWIHGSLLWMNKLKKFRDRFWNCNFKGRIVLLFSLTNFNFFFLMLFLILPFVYLMRQIGGEVLLGVVMF